MEFMGTHFDMLTKSGSMRPSPIYTVFLKQSRSFAPSALLLCMVWASPVFIRSRSFAPG